MDLFTRPTNPPNTTPNLAEHYAALRAWAKGSYPDEAATELLIRTGWARPGLHWIVDGDDRTWVDFETIPDHIGAYSGGEQRLLRLAASIGSTNALVSLSEDVPGLDRRFLALVLAAIAHANGSHEHSEPVFADDGNGGQTYEWKRLESLYAWPQPVPAPEPVQPTLDEDLAARVAEDDADLAMNRPDIL